MPRKRSATARCLAATAAILVLFAALPPAALAAQPNPWKVWWTDLGDRETKIEIPILAIVSIGPMILVTPIWLGQLALDAMGSDE
jgi:hypothetical protein